MIRAAFLATLLALPAAAQDFRGLRPGMDASALGPIGEPERIEQQGEFRASYFPLPFGQRLFVLYNAEGTIVWLSSYALPNAPDAPDLGGLRVEHMVLSDVEQFLGEERAALNQPGLALATPSGLGFRLVYDHADAEQVLVALEFVGPPGPAAQDDPASIALPRDRRLIAVDLILRDHLQSLEGYNDFIGGSRTVPITFPIPLDEAFPSLIP